MSKHTPGPWKAATTPAGKGKVVDAHGFSVCNTTAGAYEEQRANARLIAAAPELLSVAREAEALISGDLVGAEWKIACLDFTKRARAAIAKATGEGA